jgi:hypothetical protein
MSSQQNQRQGTWRIQFDRSLNLTAEEKSKAVSRLSRHGDLQGGVDTVMHWTPSDPDDSPLRRIRREGFVAVEEITLDPRTDKAALEPKAAEIVERVFAGYVTHLSVRTAKQLAMEAIGMVLDECAEKGK